MLSGHRFYDDKHFPKGFARSGYFTIKEAQVLESTGRLMKSLFEGTMLPSDSEQQCFLDEINGRCPAESIQARCWLKYQEQINRKPVIYHLCSTAKGTVPDSSLSSFDY